MQEDDWALFKYNIISPLLDDKLDRAERSRIRKEILSRCYVDRTDRFRRVADRTLSSWLCRYGREGLSGFNRRPHKAKGEMRALDEPTLQAARELRESLRSRSIEDIRMHLKYVKGTDISKVASSTLNRHLNRIGVRKEKVDANDGTYQRFSKHHINQLWQSDCSDGIWLPDPTGLKEVRQTTLITFIDDASRYCVHGEFYFSEQLVDLLDCMRTAILSRGRCTTLYTDNGSIYKANDFAHICGELGITLEHRQKGMPQGGGKQERHYLTIQMRLL